LIIAAKPSLREKWKVENGKWKVAAKPSLREKWKIENGKLKTEN
jgi:hypothetical protein